MNAIVDKVNLLNNEIELLKPAFEAYIKDKNYPLEERWNTFISANDALSNNEKYVQELETFDISDVHEYGRGEVTAERLVEMFIEGSQFEWEEKGEWRERTEEEWAIAEKNAEPLKEELLEKNLKSWLIDW